MSTPVGVTFVLTKASSREPALSKKKAFAPAQQDWVDDQHNLVNQPLLQ
jgi:hypothetical protein